MHGEVPQRLIDNWRVMTQDNIHRRMLWHLMKVQKSWWN